MHQLTEEQRAIIRHAKLQNVLVTAVPGSGKSTVGLEVMRNDPRRKTLMVTYSKQLQSETLAKARRLGLGSRAHIYTIHSLASKLFGRITKDDFDLIACLDRTNGTNFTNYCPLDLEQIIIDEVQDVTPFYFYFLLLFMKAVTRKTGKSPRLLLLGDSKQSIFDYNGGDPRFLTMAETIFQDISPYDWRRLAMTQTHRFGAPLAKFVNVQLDDAAPPIRGSSNSPQNKPMFMPVDVWNSEKLAKTLKPLIDEYGLENVSILACSTRPKTAIIQLANELSRLGYPIAGAPSDGIKYTLKTKKNKLEIASIHSYKGRERDLVIYFIDGTYYEYYGRGLPEDILPNEVYVAYTRPRKQLVILHHHTNPPLPMTPPTTLTSTCQIVNPDGLRFNARYVRRGTASGIRTPRGVIRVRDFLKSTAPHHLFHTLGLLQIRKLGRIHPEFGHIKTPEDVKTKSFEGRKLYEPVSDFVEMAITASFEHIKTGRCTSFGYGSGGKGAAPTVPTNPKLRARWLVTQAIQHDSDHHNFVARKRQLDGNNCIWLHKVLPKTDQRLEEYIGNVPSNFSFGHHVSAVIDVDGISITLGGAVDIVQSPLNGDGLILHEIEFTSPLSREIFLQIAIYGYLWAITHGMSELPPMKLLNIHDGAMWEIESTMDSVKEIIRSLAKAKYGYGNKKSDQEFIAECEDVKGKVNAIFEPSIKSSPQHSRTKKRRFRPKL